jgi:hypothetical protein
VSSFFDKDSGVHTDNPELVPTSESGKSTADIEEGISKLQLEEGNVNQGERKRKRR